jgi:tRNA(fMet)-specific endonuclease VapC
VSVVADTSEWIEYFAGRSTPALDSALAIGAVTLPPIVVAELLSGVKRREDQYAIEDLVRDLTIHDAPLDHWIRVGSLRHRLGAAGLSISTPDAHVAQCAIDLGARLLTRDRVFTRIAAKSKLTLG